MSITHDQELIPTGKVPCSIQNLGEMIKDFDLDVKIAEGGQEAIDIIDSFTPDIILLDLMMPRVNGWDVIEHVREKYSKNEMVIIVVSLLNNKDNIDECYDMGINDYITKPVIKARLTSSIESHLKNLNKNQI
nr:response regulator [uncultured Prevotella sp.]